ncbi:glycosyl transferase [Saccharobesus litoralis]|uniref:Glycosyl transferase n=1 Tax=Saccharobesus litoralis TaxID=2172099 RepID=A0A2S0VMC7_9ALTE|nr:glycosyltransferase [Saccharobesus litoralis]AWB65367.1 glycosyl transferase [Saccharobesus litoralis]
MKNKDLIVFGEDWGGLPSSTQHLINILAQDRKVLWINSIGLRQPQLSLHDIKRATGKLTQFISNQINRLANQTQPQATASESDNIRVINPATIPAPRSKNARFIAKHLLIKQIKPVVEEMQLNEPVLWISLPTAVDVIGHLNESAVVYYCGDDFSALAGVDHSTIAKREAELVNKADLILTASQALAKKFPAHKTSCIEHGVDLNLFSTPVTRASDLPNDGKPIAGFYGSINEWLDTSLLIDTAKLMPNWHFVLIGKHHIDTSELNAIKNITLLPPKAHHELPSYSQHWTVSLLPFVLNEQISACNPLKLTEYLAAGKPVIATAFNASLAYTGFVQIIKNPYELAKALMVSYDEQQQPEFANCLYQRIAHKSWQHQASKVNQLLGAI